MRIMRQVGLIEFFLTQREHDAKCKDNTSRNRTKPKMFECSECFLRSMEQ